MLEGEKVKIESEITRAPLTAALATTTSDAVPPRRVVALTICIASSNQMGDGRRAVRCGAREALLLYAARIMTTIG